MSSPTPFGYCYGISPNEEYSREASLLTPITPFPNDLSLLPDGSASAWATHHDNEEYQRENLRSYTTQILHELDAITERDLQSSSLSNPILPCLRRSQWETRDNMVTKKDADPYVSDGPSIGQKENVVWLAENDLVWKELVPILRLASWIILKISKTPWFDAMMMSERVEVPSHRFNADTILDHLNEGVYQVQNELTQIRLRPLEIVTKGKAGDLMHFLINHVLIPRMTICFVSETIDPYTGESNSTNRESGTRKFGSCIGHDDGKITLTLSYQQIAPLLNKHLNDAERLAERLGFSATSDFFGGYPDGFIKYIPVYNAPQMGFFLTSFPNTWAETSQPTLKLPLKTNTSMDISIPLPVTYYETLNSNHFWEEHVTAFGMINAPKSMGQSIFTQPHGWRIQQEDEETFAKQTRILFCKSTSDHTPYARHEMAVSTLHWNKVVHYHILTQSRDTKAIEIMDQSEWLIKSSRKQYEGYSSDFATMIDGMGELLEIHEEIINWIPEMDKYAEEASSYHIIPNARMSARCFHRDFLRFMNALILSNNKIPERQMGLQNIILRLQNLSTEIPFLNPSESITSQSDLLDEPPETEKMKSIHSAFLAASASESDEANQHCAQLCNEVIGNIGCSLYSQAQARVYKSRLSMVTMDYGEKIALLRRAKDTFDVIREGIVGVGGLVWCEKEKEREKERERGRGRGRESEGESERESEVGCLEEYVRECMMILEDGLAKSRGVGMGMEK
ncbi:hypothetical protein SBOR_4743 [Sclerotinia borealis F-4128]|uniref:Uncharacterized protein n=1 Tax=Sclerotinia borealis (strain F-4128) TaxID=1432307 RepID=W9CDP8_SCLBF|nr:hypothetical protein SBOR_4743 [Sclerotinia borealis F-4128]